MLVPSTTGETYGAVLTALNRKFTAGIDGVTFRDDDEVVYPSLKSASQVLLAGGTITPSAPLMYVHGSPGTVELDGSQAVEDGSVDGQLLMLVGDHATQFVTILDGANVELNGTASVTLQQGATLQLRWNETRSLWENYGTPGLGSSTDEDFSILDQHLLKLYEDEGNGTDFVSISAPSSLAASYPLVLPTVQGGVDTFLKNDGSGNLSWGTSTSSLQNAYDGGDTIAAVAPVTITGTGTLLDVADDVSIGGDLDLDGNLTSANAGTFSALLTAGGFAIAALGASGDWAFETRPWFDIRHPTYGAVGDGSTEDQVAIQAAIEAAEAVGGTVFFPAGTYLVDHNVLTITTGKVALVGEPGAIIKGKDGATNNDVILTIAGANSGAFAEDITIRGLEFDGNAGNSALSGSSQAHCISMVYARRVTIENNYFHDSPGDFVQVSVDDGSFPCEDITVRNNRGEVCYRNGISVDCVDRMLIEGNTCLDFNTMGIDVEPLDSGDTCRNIVIQGNTVRAALTQENTNNSNRIRGIQVKGKETNSHSNVRIIGNFVIGVTGTGDSLRYPATAIIATDWFGVVVTGNQVQDGRDGITVGGSDGAGEGTTGVCSGNTVRGCSFSTAGNAIQIRRAITCTGNLCEDNSGAGIRVSGDDCIVVGNICRNNGLNDLDASTSRQAGIWLDGANDCVVSDNRCYDNDTSKQDYGIYIDSATDCVIEGNHLEGNVVAGIGPSPVSQSTNNIRQNEGFVTEAAGQGEITSGNTSTTISHGCDVTPDIIDIHIIGRQGNSTNDPGNIWITANPTSTQFTVNCRNDPGGTSFKFAWSIHPRN